MAAKGKTKTFLLYTIMLLGFAAICYVLVIKGMTLEEEHGVTGAFGDSEAAALPAWQQFTASLTENLGHSLAILLLQIITIIVVARAFGFIFRKIGQPSVIGEIIAGIALGPSLLGAVLPEFSAMLFPPSSLGNLSVLSQIGLVLFMFVVGMELDLKILKQKVHDAVVISHASIVFPFALGIGLAYFLYGEFSPQGVPFLPFALFSGIAMSITAFPVLARIVQERGITKTKIGSIVITCAAADDITAWCILAAVIAVVKAGSVGSAFFTIVLAVAYVLVMLRLIRPFLQRLGDIYSNKETLSKPIVAVFFVTLLLSAWATEVIGIHALFGAFMAGVIMPANVSFRNIFIEKVEDVALVLLLPLFFVFTGLRTQIGLLNEPHLWGICLLIIVVAVVGKFVGSAVAARCVGQNWRDSLIIGSLMNTRGLMELVVLNIGYDLGVLTPEVFAMMVIMALVTTFMTGPALDLIAKIFGKEEMLPHAESALRAGRYGILISFGNPLTGKRLVRVANAFIRKTPETSELTALHVSLGNELNQYNAIEYEQESFAAVKEEAASLSQNVTTLFAPAQDIAGEIIKTANSGKFDLLLLGIGRSVYEGTLLGKILGATTRIMNPERLMERLAGREKMFESPVFDERTQQLLSESAIPTGVFIDKDLQAIRTVLVPVTSLSDSFLLVYVQKLLHNTGAQVSILDSHGVVAGSPELLESIKGISLNSPRPIPVLRPQDVSAALQEKPDIMLISVSGWSKGAREHSPWLSHSASVLILKP